MSKSLFGPKARNTFMILFIVSTVLAINLLLVFSRIIFPILWNR